MIEDRFTYKTGLASQRLVEHDLAIALAHQDVLIVGSEYGAVADGGNGARMTRGANRGGGLGIQARQLEQGDGGIEQGDALAIRRNARGARPVWHFAPVDLLAVREIPKQGQAIPAGREQGGGVDCLERCHRAEMAWQNE